MNIKTKYGVGDRLWPIVDLAGRAMVNPPFDCAFVFVSVHEVTYGFVREYGFPEFNVFRSEEEAQAECDRRNGGRPG